MKRTFLTLVFLSFAAVVSAQSLENMQWFNEPESWSVKGGRLTMDVTPQSDYWRISHYGFTVDDAPFLYTLRGGEFEVKVKISGEYKVRFDQAGLMLRIDKENYIKTAQTDQVTAWEASPGQCCLVPNLCHNSPAGLKLHSFTTMAEIMSAFPFQIPCIEKWVIQLENFSLHKPCHILSLK